MLWIEAWFYGLWGIKWSHERRTMTRKVKWPQYT